MILSIPETPLMDFSNGRVTSFSMFSGEFPWYGVPTYMVGNFTSGNHSTGMVMYPAIPNRAMMPVIKNTVVLLLTAQVDNGNSLIT